jgi:hypothetical protein
MIKFKAKLGSWSSVVGIPILLLNEKGECIYQLKILNTISRENQEEVAQYIVDKLNDDGPIPGFEYLYKR